MWRTVQLGDVVDVVMGQAPPGKACNKDGIGTPFVKAGEFGALSPVIKEWTTEPKKMGEKGDVFLCVVGATCGKINLGADCAIGRSVAALRPHEDKLLQTYLYYYMSQQVLGLRSGSLGAAQTVISKDMINGMSVPLPPLAEQQRIVAKLDAAFADIDKASDAQEARLQETLGLRTSLLASAMHQHLWKTVKLSEVCTLRNGRAYKKPELLAEGKYPVLRVGNFFTSDKWYYSDLELDEAKHCDNGDLLYAWSASFGARLWDGGKVIYHYHIWRVDVNESQIDKKFLFYWFEYDKELVKTAHGTGTTMMHVSKGSMEKREVFLPPLEEQRRIVHKLDSALLSLENRVNALREAKDAYVSLRSAILATELQSPQSDAA